MACSVLKNMGAALGSDFRRAEEEFLPKILSKTAVTSNFGNLMLSCCA